MICQLSTHEKDVIIVFRSLSFLFFLSFFSVILEYCLQLLLSLHLTICCCCCWLWFEEICVNFILKILHRMCQNYFNFVCFFNFVHIVGSNSKQSSQKNITIIISRSSNWEDTADSMRSKKRSNAEIIAYKRIDDIATTTTFLLLSCW